jgi:hypothetical protein
MRKIFRGLLFIFLLFSMECGDDEEMQLESSSSSEESTEDSTELSAESEQD